eukprot:687347-Lingulodinium_polyedra.AAC.1
MATATSNGRSATKASCCTKLAQTEDKSTNNWPMERPRTTAYCHAARAKCWAVSTPQDWIPPH